MIDKDAIQALQQADAIGMAHEAMSNSEATQYIVALPNDFQRIDLEEYQKTRRRARGKFTTAEVASFAAYVAILGSAESSVFVDHQQMTATAVLNLGGLGLAGHADNLAVLSAEQTAAFRALLQITSGGQHKQTTIAEFLEDWPDLIKCFHDTEQLSPPKAVAAVRKITIEGLRKIESEEQQLSATRSAFESVQATSTEKLPTLIYFTCVPYKDLPERTFVLRLQVHTANDKPTISLRIQKQELHAEEMAQEMAGLVTKALAESVETKDIPVLLGAYKKAP